MRARLLLVAICSISFASDALCQKGGGGGRVSTPPSRGAIKLNAASEVLQFTQQGQQIRQWQADTRQQWIMQDQRNQQWLRQQDQLRAMQQFQQPGMTHANSTPMFMQPVPQAQQQQAAQQMQQQYQGRQQIIQQWNLPPMRGTYIQGR